MLKLILQKNSLRFKEFFYQKNNRRQKMQTFNEINGNLKFLAQSEIRLKILSELYEKPENIRGLVKKTKINYSSVSSNVSKSAVITSTYVSVMLFILVRQYNWFL